MAWDPDVDLTQAGQCIGGIDEVKPAAEIVDDMMRDLVGARGHPARGAAPPRPALVYTRASLEHPCTDGAWPRRMTVNGGPRPGTLHRLGNVGAQVPQELAAKL